MRPTPPASGFKAAFRDKFAQAELYGAQFCVRHVDDLTEGEGFMLAEASGDFSGERDERLASAPPTKTEAKVAERN